MSLCINETSSTNIPKAQSWNASLVDYKALSQSLGDTDSNPIPSDFKHYQDAQWIGEWVDRLRSVAIRNGLWWQKPLVNMNIDSEIVLEWWHKSRKLTIYISHDDTVDFVKVWGPDVHTQMEDGSLESKSDLVSILNWIAD